jgi:tetratricopeptide (TPR) repeat protein
MEPFAEAPAAARSRGIAAADDIGGAGDGIGALADRAPEAKKKEEASGAGQGEYAPAPRDAYGSAMDLYSAGRYAEADKAFTDVSSSGAKNAANAALYAAKSAESAYGCGRAVAKYESATARFAGTSAAAEAQMGAANCYKAIGDFDRSYALYKEMRSVAGYRDRAEAELGNLRILQAQGAARSRAAPAKPASPAAPPPQATAAPKNATQPSQ